MNSFATVPTTDVLRQKVQLLVDGGHINVHTWHLVMPLLIHYIIRQSQSELNSMGAQLNIYLFFAGICELFGV